MIQGTFLHARQAQAQRDAGIIFHEERAADAVKGDNSHTGIWILLLVVAAILLIAVYALRAGGS